MKRWKQKADDKLLPWKNYRASVKYRWNLAGDWKYRQIIFDLDLLSRQNAAHGFLEYARCSFLFLNDVL